MTNKITAKDLEKDCPRVYLPPHNYNKAHYIYVREHAEPFAHLPKLLDPSQRIIPSLCPPVFHLCIPILEENEQKLEAWATENGLYRNNCMIENPDPEEFEDIRFSLYLTARAVIRHLMVQHRIKTIHPEVYLVKATDTTVALAICSNHSVRRVRPSSADIRVFSKRIREILGSTEGFKWRLDAENWKWTH